MAASAPEPTGAARERLLAHAQQGARAAWRTLSERRGLRVALAGGALVVLALVLGVDSSLALTLAMVGIVMLIVGSLGPRLRGRLSLEFGPSGTSLAVQTHIAPPGRALAAGDQDVGDAPEDAHVVEGSGETIEVELQQLRAMLASEPPRDR